MRQAPRALPVPFVFAAPLALAAALALVTAPLAAQPARPALRGSDALLAALDKATPHWVSVEQQIWGFAEVGYQEVKSSALQQAEMTAAGFALKVGVAGEPTAFIAEWGSGKPVIAIIGEFDALPGLSQAVSPDKQPIVAGAPGHGCGHHLLGTGSLAAAVAVKEWMIANKVAGTIRYIAAPAEEGGSGKVYMVRDGIFSDVDVAVSWHPSDANSVTGQSSQANISGKFRFHGIASHAAGAPERGRSALDAVEIMDVMTNFLREHVPDGTRMHYIITSGGAAPNVVPDFAEVYYLARHNDMRIVKDVWERITNAAKGAALGTGTTFDLQLVSSVYNLLINDTLARAMQVHLARVGGVPYTTDERLFGEGIQKSYPNSIVPIAEAAKVQPLKFGGSQMGSTDVGDVSWTVPTVELEAATWVPGTTAHSWQAVAAGGMTIGAKGMMVAAKTMALTAAELFTNPQLIAAAKAEFEQKRGPNFKWSTVLGNQKPALDYRKTATSGR